jgi:hypothetical protein
MNSVKTVLVGVLAHLGDGRIFVTQFSLSATTMLQEVGLTFFFFFFFSQSKSKSTLLPI